jgi:hypothetical protein
MTWPLWQPCRQLLGDRRQLRPAADELPSCGGLAGELLSPGKGLRVYSPFLAVLPTGGHTLLRRPERVLAVAALAAVAAQLLLYAKTDSRAGRYFGRGPSSWAPSRPYRSHEAFRCPSCSKLKQHVGGT